VAEEVPVWLIKIISQGGPAGVAGIALIMWWFQRKDCKDKDEIIADQYKTIVELTREATGGLANATNAVVAIDKSISRVEALVGTLQGVFTSHTTRK
jgi:plastocyanin domain-containing protein